MLDSPHESPQRFCATKPVNDAILASLASGRPEAVAATPQDPAAPAMSSS
jgi:hypothetical protein